MGIKMTKKNLWQLLICAFAFFFIGYFLRSIHYRQDLPRVEKAQAELRIKYAQMESRKELAEIMNLFFEDCWEIIDWNKAHPVIPFVEMEEE